MTNPKGFILKVPVSRNAATADFSTAGRPVLFSTCSSMRPGILFYKCSEQGDHDFMMAGKIITPSGFLRRTEDDIHHRAVMPQHIKIRRRESLCFAPEISGNSERFQKNFRQDDRRAYV